MERTLWYKIWDRYIKLYTKDFYLPNGAKHFITTTPNRHTNQRIDIKYNGQLRLDQVEWLMHIVENNWWILELSTWGGKSHIVMAIADFYKKTTLIVTPTKKLVKEMVDKFKEFTNYTPWTFYSDGKNIQEITVTTHTSFVNDILVWHELPKFDVLLIDEMDSHFSPKMLQALCLCDCNILVGLSGTPTRQDLNTQDLELVFGPHIKIWDYQILPTTITQYVYQRDVYEQSMIDYTSWHYQRESMMTNKDRFNRVISTIKDISKKHYLTLVLLDRMEEMHKFSLEFPDALVITGSTKIEDDEMWIRELQKKWWIILWSIMKVGRGMDISECDNVIIASPIKFQNTVIQAIWRALRKCDSKWDVNISIFNDNVLKSQRYSQAKTCKEEYGMLPNVIYIKK